MGQALVFACGGDSENAPHSTLTAFERAIAAGADGIQFACHLTKDDRVVVHQAYCLGEMDDGTGCIGDHTLEALADVDAGSWFAPEFGGERIPALGAVLELGKGRVRFEVDVRSRHPRLLGVLAAEIARYEVEDAVEVTSTQPQILLQSKRVGSDLRTGLLFNALPAGTEAAAVERHIVGWLRQTRADVAHLPASVVGRELVARLHEEGHIVHGSNLDTADEMASAIRAGVDQLSTATLSLALRVRAEQVQGTGGQAS
jgi:glycerophosphoryl diester phosphodiesterase